jgi:hypothetical protein
MNETILVAVLSMIGTLIGTFGGIMTSQKLISYRIEQLEKKVEKHNNVVERVFRLEDNAQLIEEKIKVCSHRIDTLENGK